MTTSYAKVLESNLWQWLKRGSASYGRTMHLRRIENESGAGHPDVEGKKIDTDQFWIELKTCARPKRDTTACRPVVRPAQVEWIKRRVEVGGNVWLLIQVGAKDRILVPGVYVDQIREGVTLAEMKDMGFEVRSGSEVFELL